MKQKRGMSLIEILVAVTIITMLLVGVFNILPVTLLAVFHAEQQYAASQVAQSIIEQQRATPASKMVPVSNKRLSPVTDDGITFSPFLTIQAMNNNAPPLMMVSVIVAWQSNGTIWTTRAQLEVTDLAVP